MLLIAATIGTVPVMAQHEVDCFNSITEDFPAETTTTLYSGTPYRLEGCIHVPAGATLVIQAGAIIMGEKASNGTLIVEKGAQLISQGTAMNPVVFTSDQDTPWRQPGDWGGVAVAGYAKNNQSNSITLSANRTCSFTGGGTDNSDNSGVFKYMRIEFPRYGLSMVSVGNGTEFHDVEVLYASENSLELYGGTVEFKHFVSYNAKRSDILATHGNLSKGQYILGMRLDQNAYVTTGDLSHGIVFANNDDAMSSYASSTGADNNHPVFSNVTLIGPAYCGEMSVNANFKNGVLYHHNTEGGVYNSIVAGWPVGFRMEDYAVDNANINFTLNFAENTFYNNYTDYATATSWTGTCAGSLANWMNGSGSTPCKQRNNQFGAAEVGLSTSICDDLCDSYPVLPLNTSAENFELTEPQYSVADLDDDFFDEATFRGAFDDATDWVSGWGLFCGQTVYCPELRMGRTTGIGKATLAANNLTVSPNPASNIFYAMFNTDAGGSVTITVSNSMGQIVRTATSDVHKGSQRIAVNVDGLSGGIYIVSVAQQGGEIGRTRFVVK